VSLDLEKARNEEFFDCDIFVWIIGPDWKGEANKIKRVQSAVV
jgi:hypothetical protein